MKSPKIRFVFLGLFLAALVVAVLALFLPAGYQSPVAADRSSPAPQTPHAAAAPPAAGITNSVSSAVPAVQTSAPSASVVAAATAPSASGSAPAAAYQKASNTNMKGKTPAVSSGLVCPDPVFIGPRGQAMNYALALDEIYIRRQGKGGELLGVAASDRRELATLISNIEASGDAEAFAVLYPEGQERSEDTRRLLSDLVTVKFSEGFDLSAIGSLPDVVSFEAPAYSPDHVIVRTVGGLAALDVASQLAARPNVELSEPQLALRPLKFQVMPNDPLVGTQWHLKFQNQNGAVAGTDINVESVWNYPGTAAGVRGRGIRIGIVDDGLQTAHPDLAPNVDTLAAIHRNYNKPGWDTAPDYDPNPRDDGSFGADNHGTSCAGDAAARGNNGLGVSGSAPEAKVVGMRLIADWPTDAQIADAMVWRSDLIEIKSNSWGFPSYADGFTLSPVAMANAVSSGRSGLGTVFLFAAGNSGQDGESPNYNALQNAIQTICVAAFDSQGRQSFYSEPGANIIVAGPSNGALPALGKTTTDRTGNDGYNTGQAGELPDTDYTLDFGGTSSATPTVAGVVALMLEANPALGWRDVQEILLRSSRKVVPSDTGWVTNQAGINHNPKFGAGLVDAAAAVGLARTWTNLGAPITRTVAQPGLNRPLPDNNAAGVTVNFTVPNNQNIRVEHVRLSVVATHTYRGDLRIVLRSPTGIESVLAAPFDESGNNLNWTYTSVRNWGENGAGTWTLRVSDEGAQDTGTLNSATLTLHGTAAAPIDPPPSVSLLSPVEGGNTRITPGQSIVLEAEASDVDTAGDPSPIASLQFLVDGTPLPSPSYVHSPVSPGRYEYAWTPPLGTYKVTARASDSAGKVSLSGEATLQVRYPPAGSVREDFIPPSANDHVQALAADPQGRVYVGGLFTQLNGSGASRVARLRSDGSVDPTFFVGTGPDAQVRALLHSLEDKSLYVGGNFAAFAGTPRRAFVRLRVGQSGFVDGALDTNFNPAVEGASASSPPYVVALARQPDGKILVGGSFSKVNSLNRFNLARLNPDGSLDVSFAPNPVGVVNCLALQPDGKILVGGSFSQIDGQASRRMARLNPDGSIDTTFVTGGSAGGFDGSVNSIAVTLDGEIIAGGQFNSYNGRSSGKNMTKLLSNGALGGKFNSTPGLNGVVNDVHLRPTGQILVSGLFTEVANNTLGIGATSVGRVFQIDTEGFPDADFNPGEVGADNSVLDSITLPNGDILLAGAFRNFNGVPRERLAVVAGYEASAPMITSALFRNVDAGVEFSHAFSSTGRGPFVYSLHSGTLPMGLRMNGTTGRLEGVPLEAGRFKLEVVSTAAGGAASEPTGFVLHVNEAKVSFAQWRKAWFTGGEQSDSSVSGPMAVRNAAGLSNFMVFAMGGGDPRSADGSLVPVVRRERIGTGHYLTMVFPKYRAANVTYRPEVSADLAQWSWSVPSDLVIISNGPDEMKVRAAAPATGLGRQFLRLKVLEP